MPCSSAHSGYCALIAATAHQWPVCYCYRVYALVFAWHFHYHLLLLVLPAAAIDIPNADMTVDKKTRGITSVSITAGAWALLTHPAAIGAVALAAISRKYTYS
jgi:hypothetical protein